MTSPTSPSLLTQIETDLIAGTPVADVLRKLVLFGGQAGSVDLREWASQELRGYPDATVADLPDYRKVSGAIQVDAVVAGARITGQTISPAQLPEGPRGVITNEVSFFQSVAELQALTNTERSHRKFAIPEAQVLGQMIDKAAAQPFQHTTDVYWSVSVSALEGIIDQVKTRLAELLAELRAVTPSDSSLPTPEQVSNAVNVVVHGRGNRVRVSGVAQDAPASTAESSADDGPFWTLGKRIAAFAVGLATVVGTVVAIVGLHNAP